MTVKTKARSTRESDAAPGQVSELEVIAEPLRALALEIGSVNMDPANARRHGERNLDAIRASLVRFGQRTPIVVRRRGMVTLKGNGTLEAARALGWTHIAALIVDDDNLEATAYALADNRTAELATWDNDALVRALEAVREADPDWESLGFSGDELEAIAGQLAPPNFEPGGADDQQRLDEKDPVTCPSCGHAFHPAK